jgi:hypothetical protein
MALAGVHLEFSVGSDGDDTRLGIPVLRSGVVSGAQTMATAGTSTIAAPGVAGVAGNGYTPLLSISASAPIFFAVGPTPDATNGARRYMDPANGGIDVFVNPGDRVAWILA